jgi:hypothetical protein
MNTSMIQNLDELEISLDLTTDIIGGSPVLYAFSLR